MRHEKARTCLLCAREGNELLKVKWSYLTAGLSQAQWARAHRTAKRADHFFLGVPEGLPILDVMWWDPNEKLSDKEWWIGMSRLHVTLPPSSSPHYSESCRTHWKEHMLTFTGMLPECPPWCAGVRIGAGNEGTCPTCCKTRALEVHYGQENYLDMVLNASCFGLDDSFWVDHLMQSMLGDCYIGSD